jgi:predicted TIM-barrel fold metal-dependent hydrolase
MGEIAPDRLIWGSDWPHTGVFDANRMADDGALLDFFGKVFPSPVMQKKILVTNPTSLLGL